MWTTALVVVVLVLAASCWSAARSTDGERDAEGRTRCGRSPEEESGVVMGGHCGGFCVKREGWLCDG